MNQEIEEIETTNDEVTCTACLTIPVSHLSLEEGVSVPIGGWPSLFEEQGIRVVTDTAGRRAISTLAARRLFAALKRRDELSNEASARRFEKIAARHPVRAGGLPVVEGASPYESMVAAEGGIVTPSAEFGSGREKPRFLEEELAEGERALREKQRLIDQAKNKLGGKR